MTSSRLAWSRRASTRCATPGPPVDPFQESRHHGDERFAALGRSHERLVGDLVRDGPVAGVTDTGPNREPGPGDGAGHLLGVEGREISFPASSADQDDQLRLKGLESREGGRNLSRRFGTLHGGGFEAHVESVAGAFQLTGEITVGLRAWARDEPHP